MPRKILALALVALLASASLAEAGLFGGCGGGAAGRRGLFGRRGAYAAAPCGQAGFSASASYSACGASAGYSASYYSATSYGAACGVSAPATTTYQYGYGASSFTFPAPATYVAPVVTASPQSASIEGWRVPSKSVPIPNDHRSDAPWLKNDNGSVPPPPKAPVPAPF
jgi:hypothetical protein